MEPVYERDWMTQEEATAFIGDNAPFYLEKWKLHFDTTCKGWNWAAAFFGIEWMAYRKMYLEAVLFFAVVFFVSIVGALFLPVVFGDLFGYGFRILLGAFGNTLYRKKALRTLRRTAIENDSERLKVLSQRGGVSTISVVVVILLEVAYGFLIACL